MSRPFGKLREALRHSVFDSVAHGEALPLMLWLLQFIHESNREVLERNPALLLVVHDQRVCRKSEFARALAGLKIC